MSLNVGKISGIDIRLNFSWFLIFGLLTWSLAANYLPSQYPEQSVTFYWIVGAMAAVTLFISLLAHELAHSLVAQGEGMSIRSITLHFFGGVSELGEESRTPDTELKMASVGPISSLLIGLFFLVLWRTLTFSPLGLRAIFQYASYANLGLALFNSIPAFPMDGGRVLRALLWRRRDNILEATRTATTISKVISYLFMGLGVFSFFAMNGIDGLWLMVIGFIINGNATASLSQTMISRALSDVSVEKIMTRDVKSVEPDLTIQQVVDRYFQRYAHNGFPVMQDGDLVGMICSHDIQQIPEEQWDMVKVEDVMKPGEELYTVSPESNSADALMEMAKRDIGRLPVLRNGEMVGLITRSDITRAIRLRTPERGENREETAVKQIVSG
ncbi:MAG: site-2 protease family protein [Candidatus Bathyarchaeia archaeon]